MKETIEHKGYCTGAQGLMLLYDLKHNYCDVDARLQIKALPATLKLADRERSIELRDAKDINVMIDNARLTLSNELEERCFLRRPSNARMVQLYMSKQMAVVEMLDSKQYELSKTLYLQWLREANEVAKLAVRTSPRKAQKTSHCGGLFRGASMVVGLDSASPARSPAAVTGSFDPVTEEIDRWDRLAPDVVAPFMDDDGLLNEFQMMWSLRERFPLHFIVFKRTACHLPHEANVEQVFTHASNLTLTPTPNPSPSP